MSTRVGVAHTPMETRRDVIVETGVYDGGSALLFATFCGRVISIEKGFRSGVKDAIRATAGDRVSLIEGDSASAETAALIRTLIRSEDRVFVFLDSDHSQSHVAAELASLAPFVTPGSYSETVRAGTGDNAGPA